MYQVYPRSLKIFCLWDSQGELGEKMEGIESNMKELRQVSPLVKSSTLAWVRYCVVELKSGRVILHGQNKLPLVAIGDTSRDRNGCKLTPHLWKLGQAKFMEFYQNGPQWNV